MVTPRAGKARRQIGLDIGSHSLKVAELERTPVGVRLVKQLVQELPLPQAGQAVDRVGWLQSALKEFDASEIHLSIGGPDVAIRRVHLPLMCKRELPEAVKWQVKEQIPFPIQDAILDFQVIGEVWEKDVKKQDVLVAAASASSVRALVELVERCNVRVASVTPTQLALWRCVTELLPDARQGSVAVLEIGAAETEVTIAKDGHVRLVRDLAIGSATLTEALIGVVASEGGEQRIDYSRAEALKRRYGILRETAEGTTEEGVSLFQLSSLMRPVLERLLTELSRVFDFYKVHMGEADVSRVLLCGGGAGIKQLQPFLAEGLGLTVEVFNPLIRMAGRVQPLEPEQVAEGGPRLGVAIGLALDRGRELTLLPAGPAQQRRVGATRRFWLGAAAAAAALALSVLARLGFSAGLLQRQIRAQETLWMSVEPSYQRYMNTTAERKSLEGTMLRLEQLLDQQPAWEGLLKEIGGLIPPTVELEELAVAPLEASTGKRTIHLRGQARSSAGGQGGLPQFLEALESSIFFREVRLVSSELQGIETGRTSFVIEGLLE
jgi:type IV pilus assembly protein PilM